jgi:N-acetylmuramic acid 6-phosphate etherase
MQLNNSKLYKRGVDIVMKETGADEETAKRLLKKHGSIREAIEEASRR